IGEACTAANRFIVHESIAGEFARRLAAEFPRLEGGDPLAEGTDVGPLISADAREQVHSLVSSAITAGAQLLTGGEVPDGPGHHYPPTVLAGVGHDAAILGEEIFGPVAVVTSFRDEAEALRIANATRMGLAAYAYTRDPDRIQRLGALLETGMIGINTGVLSNAAAPFGGVKQSGIGREGSRYGLDEYLEVKYLCFGEG